MRRNSSLDGKQTDMHIGGCSHVYVFNTIATYNFLFSRKARPPGRSGEIAYMLINFYIYYSSIIHINDALPIFFIANYRDTAIKRVPSSHLWSFLN